MNELANLFELKKVGGSLNVGLSRERKNRKPEPTPSYCD
jgi:hypothetical protein